MTSFRPRADRAPNQQHKVHGLIQVGDVISLAQRFEELNDRVVIGRNFDDRVGVYAMLEAMKRVGDCQVDVYAIDPDVGIAIDGSLSSDIPYAAEQDRHCTMGAGTGIYLIDKRTISDRRLVQFLVQLAEEKGIPYQMNLGGGTDASIIQRNRTGARACTIGAPTRYMHSTAQLCSKQDVEATIALLVAFVENAHRGELG